MKRKYVKTPTVYQMEATECGAASLAMITAYYGKHIPLDKLRIDTGVSRDGCKASKILKGARKHGFDADGYSMGIEALKDDVALPCIIHWNFNHFVVFEGIKGGHAYINDPASGRRRLTMEELDDGFTGVTLTFKPNGDFVKEKNRNSILFFAMKMLKGQGFSMLYMLLVGLVLVVPGIILPVLTRIFIDDILVLGNTDWIRIIIVSMLAAALFQAGFGYYRQNLLIKLQNKLSVISTYKFLFHLFRLPMAFFDQRFSGDLSSRVTNSDEVSNFLITDFIENVLNIFVSVIYLALLFMYSWQLALIGVATVAVNLTVMKLSSDYMSRSIMKLQQDTGTMFGVMLGGINIITTLKAAGVENRYAARVLGHHAKTATKTQEHGKLMQIVNSIPEVTTQICNILVLIVGGVLVINGSITAGMLVAFNTLLGSFMKPTGELMGFAQKLQKAKADMARVEDILNYEQDEIYQTNEKRVVSFEKLSGALKLDKVAFGYSRLEKPLINDLEIEVKPGRSIAVVGASGSGKSTVSKLISGLYCPWEGTVYFDGIPKNEIPPEILNSSISTVSQEISLFAGSVKENITMWNRSVRDYDIVRAAKDACIHDTITKKPGAYDYMLTEGGKNMSGGQRQRLEIARALVTNPTILVMDEATSALDAVVEKEIIDNIKRRACTCIVVAHRLSTIRDCDEIIVTEKGQVVQRGTHDELAKAEGHYQRLMQTGGKAV